MNWDGLEPVAGWQPMYAPTFQDSLWNFRSGMASVLGVGPSFDALTGWIGHETNTGLNRLGGNILIQPTWTIISRQYHASGNFGLYTWANSDNTIEYMARSGTTARFVNGGIKNVSISVAPHVVALVGKSGVAIDGKYEANAFSGGNAGALLLCLYAGGTTACFAVYDTTLTPDQIWQRTQMIWNLDNPDWNAWTPAHRWFFVPPASAALWRGVGRNSSPVGGSLGVTRQ